MPAISPGLILALLTSICLASLFHLLVGGSLGRLLIWLLVAFPGFLIGNLLGGWLGLILFTVGTTRLLAGILGAAGAIIFTWQLMGKEEG
jgi:hypothetical protein